MIEPLRLKTIEQQILIEDHFSSSGDKHGERKTVHSFVIDSGPFKGSVVGHLRYLFDTTDTEYPWQVIKQHSPKDCDRRHYSTVKT